MELELKTLTPRWTGGVDGKMDRIHEPAFSGVCAGGTRPLCAGWEATHVILCQKAPTLIVAPAREMAGMSFARFASFLGLPDNHGASVSPFMEECICLNHP